MSGRPNVEQINELREHVQKLARAKQDCFLYQRRINKYSGLLENAEEMQKEMRSAIVKLMDEMDVRADGNFGWENRFMTFIAELVCPNMSPTEESE